MVGNCGGQLWAGLGCGQLIFFCNLEREHQGALRAVAFYLSENRRLNEKNEQLKQQVAYLQKQHFLDGFAYDGNRSLISIFFLNQN